MPCRTECDRRDMLRNRVNSAIEVPSGVTGPYGRWNQRRDSEGSGMAGSTRHTPGESGAGSSARREYERRRARDEERLRRSWGRLGGVAVALSSERQSTTAWASGATGEEQVGARLDKVVSNSVAVLHDRRIPRSRANIDHLVITPAGIWVIDTKRYKGGRPRLKVEGGFMRPRVEKLMIGGRDRTRLVDGVRRQVDVVDDILGELLLPVRGVLCFVGADWPLLGGDFTTRGVQVLWPRKLVKLVTATPYGPVDVPAVHQHLARHLRPA